MKYGVHAGLWMARWTDDIVPIMRIVSDLGFDGIEISLLGMSDEKAEALGSLASGHGLNITCSDGLTPQADITSADADIRKAGREYLRWAVRTAAKMGSQSLAGVIYAPWGVYEPDRKEERAAYASEAFAALDADLKARNVKLGIEAINRFETDLVNTAREATRIAEDSNSEHVGVLLDTYHLNMEEKEISRAIAETGEKLFHFHVSENDRGVPGSGHLPWNDVKAGLDELSYDDWIVAEIFVIAGNPASADLKIWRNIEPDATDAARRSLDFMRKTFG
ncbi:MAG: sugar phosphate isomerase/epimerase [Albidovulum sp.]|nr:sugar phosphate isomerase/epimerase [Albidovulum sp.]MDE0529911.1 sugar phosphate isomerase/epimerase [Albidovulum sp.]